LECDLLGIQQLNRIERKVDYIMAQIDDLKATLTAIGSDTDEIIQDFANLQAALATANANSGVDLTDVNAAANAIRTKLDALASSANPAPAPAPADNGGADVTGA
jgi:multidrug resistance efflux pump